MKVEIHWTEKDSESVAQIIGLVVTEIPHNGRIPITVSTQKLATVSVTTVSNEVEEK